MHFRLFGYSTSLFSSITIDLHLFIYIFYSYDGIIFPPYHLYSSPVFVSIHSIFFRFPKDMSLLSQYMNFYGYPMSSPFNMLSVCRFVSFLYSTSWELYIFLTNKNRKIHFIFRLRSIKNKAIRKKTKKIFS